MAEYKVNGQINLGWNQSFAATKAVPMIAKRVWDTLENATLFAKEDATAVVGLILTVNNDSTNNGVYRIAAIGADAILEKVGDVDLSNYYNKEEVDGLIPEIPSIYLNGVEQEVIDGKIELEFEIPAPEDVDLSGYYTKEEADSTFATKEEIPSLDGYLTSSDAEATYVKQEGYVVYSQDEKDKLAGIADGAEVNYVKSVGDNLAVDAEGKLTVTIPEVDVPFQVVSESDKILTLEGGILSAAVTFAKETLEGQEYLVIRGKNNEELGKVSTAEFTADSFLDDVTIDGGNINFTWNMADGTEKTDSVDLSNYIKPYNADGTTIELNAETNTFSVKDGVFAKSADTLSGYGITDAKIEDGVITLGSNTITPITSHQDISGLATKTELTEGLLTKQDTITETNLLSAGLIDGLADVATTGSYNDLSDTPDLSIYVEKEDGSRLITETEATKLEGIEEGAEVNVIEVINIKTDKDVEAIPVEVVEKAVTIDLSGIDERLEVLEAVINPEGSDTDITDLIAGKQDKLADGSATTPHLIWDSTNTKWTPGKIDALPSTDSVESPAILAWDGENVIWSSSEVQKELPEYSIDNAGQILTVNTEGNIIWQAAPVSTTVTKDVITEGQTQTYTITQDENSVTVYDSEDVYTKTEVDSMFTWQTV